MRSPYKGRFKVTQQFKGNIHDGLDLVGLDGKEIYSTVNGRVEKAGWESLANKKKGFGLYVRILKDNSRDKYYFGHLSELRVKAGDRVKVGDIIGIEGSTGYSSGSHCHYCARTLGLKSKALDISLISGIPNKIGVYSEKNTQKKKTAAQLAMEVIQGKWGNGEERRLKLRKAGYDYCEIQKKVNELLKGGK